MPKLPTTILFAAACGLALLAPAVATAAPIAETTNEAVVATAKASPLFKREVKRAGLRRAGLEKIRVRDGIEMDLLQYVKDTGLDHHARTEPLFDAKLRPQYLGAAPTYRESIVVLEDRIVVDRRLTVPLLADACSDAAAPPAITELCFVKNPGNKRNKAITGELVKLRAELAKADPAKIVRGTTTAKQALDLDDDGLLEFLLNDDVRTIHHVSVIPRIANAPGGKGTDGPLGKFDTALVPSGADTNLVKEFSMGKPDVAQVGDVKDFATRYFLTGFTYGREIEDAWEYTIANSTWLTDRYYVRLSYELRFGLGLRAPFSIGLRSTGSGNSRRVDVSVAPVDVDTQGNPAYPAVGLPANKTFEGREFVLEFYAGCNFYASIPGPNVDKSCPTIDKNYSRDIDPVIGTESSAIHDWWLDGSVTGLGIDLSVVRATIDIGVGADVTNGRVRMRAAGTNGATVSGVTNGTLSFSNRNAFGFDVSRTPGSASAGLRLDQPRYGFDVRLRPKLRGKVDLDVAVYEHQWIIGPYALDFLSISQSFWLDHHDGTVAQHDYAVFDNGLVVALPDDPPPPPPGPKGPKGGKGGKVPSFPPAQVEP